VEIIGKKCTQKNLFRQKLLQVGSIEEDRLQFCTLFAKAFSVSNVSHFSQQSRNQRKILCCLDVHIQILRRKCFRYNEHYLGILTPNSQETAQNFEKRVLQKFF
jgi:hypothetical protein